MDFFEWNPSVDEKVKIVVRSMEDLVYSKKYRDLLADFVTEYADMPVSFFVELRHDIFKERLGSYIINHKKESIGELINSFPNCEELQEVVVIEKLHLLNLCHSLLACKHLHRAL